MKYQLCNTARFLEQIYFSCEPGKFCTKEAMLSDAETCPSLYNAVLITRSSTVYSVNSKPGHYFTNEFITYKTNISYDTFISEFGFTIDDFLDSIWMNEIPYDKFPVDTITNGRILIDKFIEMGVHHCNNVLTAELLTEEIFTKLITKDYDCLSDIKMVDEDIPKYAKIYYDLFGKNTKSLEKLQFEKIKLLKFIIELIKLDITIFNFFIGKEGFCNVPEICITACTIDPKLAQHISPSLLKTNTSIKEFAETLRASKTWYFF